MAMGVEDLYVASSATDEVRRYDSTTGAFIDAFVSSGDGGLDEPADLLFGPDGNLYVTSGGTFILPTPNRILKFDGDDGAFLGEVVSNLEFSFSFDFGDDGNIYVPERNINAVRRYDGATGELIDTFISDAAGDTGGLRTAKFGVDLTGDGVREIYVVNEDTRDILRYDGADGSLVDTLPTPPAFGINMWIEIDTGWNNLCQHARGARNGNDRYVERNNRCHYR